MEIWPFPFDPDRNVPIRIPTKDGPTTAVALSLNGKWAATGSKSGLVRLYEVATGQPVGSPMLQTSTIEELAFIDGDQSLVCGTQDGNVRTWKVARGYQPRRAWKAESRPDAVAYGPEGRSLLAVMSNTSRLWDPATGDPLGEARRHPENITGMTVSPDGADVLTVSWSNNPSGDEDRRLKGRVYRQKMGDAPATAPWFEIDSALWSVTYTRGGRAVLFQTSNGQQNGFVLQLRDSKSGHPLGEPWMPKDGLVDAVAIDPSGRIAMTGTSIGKWAQFWDFTTNPPTPLGQPVDHIDFIPCVALDPIGSKGATGCRDGVARLWDATTRKPIGVEMKHPFPVKLLVFSPDGKTLLTGSADDFGESGEARLWDANSGQPLTPPLKTAHRVTAGAFHPDGRTVAIGDGNLYGEGNISIWDLPVPTTENVETLYLQTQLETGLELSEIGEIRVLSPETWLGRKGRLDKGMSDIRR